MGICNFRCLFIWGSFCLFFAFCCCFCFFLDPETVEGRFFQRVYLYRWVIAGDELSTLSKRIHNSLTVYDNSWALKFDNFSEFQNVISDSPSVIMTHCVPKSICDSKFLRTPLLQNNSGRLFLNNWFEV